MRQVMVGSFVVASTLSITSHHAVLAFAPLSVGLARAVPTKRRGHVTTPYEQQLTENSGRFGSTRGLHQATSVSVPVELCLDKATVVYALPENETDAALCMSMAPVEVAMEVDQKDSFIDAWSEILAEKIGTVDHSRLSFPEYVEGTVPRMFSALQYERCEQGRVRSAQHAAGSVMGAAALIAGTTVGAGVLAMPTATAAAGFIPSTFALLSAWIYMTMSGLLIAELTLNRIGETGRPGFGLLDLYKNSLGSAAGHVASAAYFFLHYAMMVAYIAQGGTIVEGLLPPDVAQVGGAAQVAFATMVGLALYLARPAVVEQVNNVMVLGVVATFLAIVGMGAGTVDFPALLSPDNQHPEFVVRCFPILFLAMVYQNVVPTVVTQLEGDRRKITKAIIAGTTTPMLMFVAWNVVVLGNIYGADVVHGSVDPVAVLQSGEAAGPLLGSLVTTFSALALLTSMVGFLYGLLDAWTDVFRMPNYGPHFEQFKLPLYALIFVPPLLLSMTDPSIFYRALDYGGAFGVSTLFLILPPLMVWQERYGETEKPLYTTPMVPFGKIPLASMWKAAATLIVEQSAEKLGVIDYLGEIWRNQFG